MALSAAVREVVPAQWTRFGLIEQGQPTIGFGEHPDFIPLFYKTFATFANDPFMQVFFSQIESGSVGGSLSRQNGAYLESRYHNEFERPLDSCWLLECFVHDGRSALAALSLSRPRMARPFTDRDVQTLRLLQPWMMHALREKPQSSSSAALPSASGNSAGGTPVRHATAIFDTTGKALFHSEGAEHLYMILNGAVESGWRNMGSDRPRPPALIGHLIRSLVAAATRGGTRPPGAPYAALDTPWGLITAEAAWLTSAATSDPAALAGDIVAAPGDLPVAVTLTLHEHAAVRAARILRHSGATPTQMKVGMMLATGSSKPEIAQALGIKPTSVIDAARKLHGRLGTRNAADLGMRLWLGDGGRL